MQVQNAKDAKINKLQHELEALESSMGPLVQLIREDKSLQFDFDKRMELGAFQREVLSIIVEFIWQDTINTEDVDIVNEGIIIWVSCLSSEPTLLNSLMSGKDEMTSQFAATFIEKGLMSREYRVRDAFQNAIRHVVNTVRSPDLTQSALSFFLRLLISKFDFVSSNKQASKHSRMYFSVLLQLLEEFFTQTKAEADASLGETSAFVKDTVERLMRYEPDEQKNSLTEDDTLCGFLKVIRIFL